MPDQHQEAWARLPAQVDRTCLQRVGEEDAPEVRRDWLKVSPDGSLGRSRGLSPWPHRAGPAPRPVPGWDEISDPAGTQATDPMGAGAGRKLPSFHP